MAAVSGVEHRDDGGKLRRGDAACEVSFDRMVPPGVLPELLTIS
jgi:hypothetical protein